MVEAPAVIRRSHPARGAWIEIKAMGFSVFRRSESHPARGAWIEIVSGSASPRRRKSHPARGAWIEIIHDMHMSACRYVAPRKGCVD